MSPFEPHPITRLDRVGRRDFLKISGAAVGALVVGACGGSGSSGGDGPTRPPPPPPPADLGVFCNYHAGDDFTRALGATVRRNSIAWQRDETGTWVSVAAQAWRDNHHPAGSVYTGRQFIAEPNATNLAPNGCRFGTNHTAGWTVASTEGATLSVVDDAAKIATAGLQNLAGDTTCLNFDNSAGRSTADVSVNLGTLTADLYSFHLYIRGGTGSIFINQGQPVGQVSFAASGNYAMVVSRSVTTAALPATLVIRADAGQVVQFLLPQVELGASETSPVPNATTGVVKRISDSFTWPFTGSPGAMSIYMRRTWTPFYRFNPYFGVGQADSDNGQFIHLGNNNGTHTRLLNGGTSSVSGDTTNPNLGDDCMIVGRFDANGNGQVEQSLNGQPSTFSTPATDSPGYGDGFIVSTAAIGRYTGVALPIVGSHIVIARATTASLAVLEAL